MKKKLSPAKAPLPKFQSDQEAAEYFESHSAASVWDQLPEAPSAKPLPAQAKKIRNRHARLKSPISIRLAPEQIGRLALDPEPILDEQLEPRDLVLVQSTAVSDHI